MRAAPFERRRATAAGRGVHLAAAAVVHGHSPSALFFSLLSLFLHRYLWSLSSSFPALPANWRHVVGRATEGEARTAATGGEVGRRIRPVRAARARGAAVEVHRFPLHGLLLYWNITAAPYCSTLKLGMFRLRAYSNLLKCNGLLD